MSDRDPTISARTGRYRDAQEARGLTQVKVWVPANRAAELREIARKMREGGE